MSENDNIQKLQQLYAAFGRGDINMILNNVTDDVTWGIDTTATEVPWYPIREGRGGVGDFFATLDREVEFTHFAPTHFAAAGNLVFVHVDIGYKLKKNGRTASTGSNHQFTVRDGKIARFRAFEDTAAVRDAWNG
jgi:ketosteroid isomerase-like protein